jgi:hypothetical protein
MRPEHVPHLPRLATNLGHRKDGAAEDDRALVRRLTAPLWVEGSAVEDDPFGLHYDDTPFEAPQVAISKTQQLCQQLPHSRVRG